MEIGDESIRSELEKILSSPEFLRNDRLSKFLRFTVEQQLEGKAAELKESVVGIEVFGREPGYDPRRDSIVRTEAAKLRSRLSKYYEGLGAADPIVIDLPKGGYAPVFRRHEPSRDRTFNQRVWLAIAVAVAGFVLVLTAARWWGLRQRSSPIAIAVLPLENLSHDPANDYFADGLTDEIIRNLSIVEGLVVRSRTSSFALKGKLHNARETGKQLEADYILEGSVLRSGQQLRINTQLIRVRDDLPLWAGKFDREFTDVFAIQDEISRGIVNSLRLSLGQGRRRYETSAEAHGALAMAYARDAQWEQSEKSFQRAIELDPGDASVHGHFALNLLVPFGRIDEALLHLRIAKKLDPLAPERHFQLAYVLVPAGRYDEAASECRALPEDFWGTSSCLGWARYWQGKTDEAMQILEAALRRGVESGSEIRGYLGYAYARAGRREEAEQLASGTNPLNQAMIFVGMGDKDRAFEALDRGVTAGPFRIGRLLAWPELAALRGDPRVKALRKKVGLPPTVPLP